MNKEPNQNWWRPGLILFGRLSGWIMGPVIVALLLGKFLDKKLDSEPWFFLGLTGLAFFVCVFGLIKETMKYMGTIEKNKKDSKTNDTRTKHKRS